MLCCASRDWQTDAVCQPRGSSYQPKITPCWNFSAFLFAVLLMLQGPPLYQGVLKLTRSKNKTIQLVFYNLLTTTRIKYIASSNDK